MDRSKDDDMISVYIWTKDIDYNAVERKTVLTSGLSKNTLMEKSNELYEPLIASLAPNILEDAVTEISASTKSSKNHKTADKITEADTISLIEKFYSTHKDELKELSASVDTYIETRRAVAREAYDVQNGGFADNYLKSAQIIFRGEYAPMIICEIPKKTVLYLNTLNVIDSLSLYEHIEFADAGSIDIGAQSIEGDYTRDRLNLDGAGIKVGEIEELRPNMNAPELSGTNITVGGKVGEDVHATLVAAIITKMAPAAELYCTTVDNFYVNIEWLISSGVSVINFSGDMIKKGILIIHMEPVCGGSTTLFFSMVSVGERVGEISNKEGAGVVNAYYAVLASINITTGKKSYYDTTNKTITYNYTASKSGKGIVVISWLKHCTVYSSNHADVGSITSYGFPDLDLFVYDSSGKEVARSQSSINSVEMASFNAIANQTYTVVIERKSTDMVNVAIAHSII